MKKLLYFAAAVLALAACQKEVNVNVDEPVNTRTVTITAGFDNETKTAYDAQGKFSWVAGDKIGVMVQKDAELKQVTFTAKSTGAVSQFEGEVEEGWEVAELASYPFTGVTDGYACNDFAWCETNTAGTFGWRLWGSIKPDLEKPLESVPLIGKKNADGTFAFKTATGIVKFTVKNVPFETAYGYLEVPDATKTQYNLNGWYALGEDGYPTMASAIEPWENRYNWNVPTDYNQEIDYYFFIPEGKLPVGTKFELCNSSWAAIKSFVTAQEVDVVRNVVVSVAPVEVEAYTPNLEENQIWIKPWNIKVNNDAIYTSNGNPYEGGGIPAMVDGKTDTYWHSAWYAGGEAFADPTVHDDKYGITVDITLEEAIQDFKLSYYVRHNNNNGEPREIIFAGSNDGTTWTDIQTVADETLMKVAAGTRVDLPEMHAAEPVKYLRLGITKAGNGETPSDLTTGSGSTALAEILLFNVPGEPPAPANVDVIDNAFTGVSGTTYTDWTNTGASGAVYVGQTAADASTVQMRSDPTKAAAGIVTTVSAGVVKKVAITWNSKTAANRFVDVFAKNTPYEAVADQNDPEKRGYYIGSIDRLNAETDLAGELDIPGNFAYIMLRSADSALYLDDITITWDLEGTPADPTAETPSYVWDFSTDEWQAKFGEVAAAGSDAYCWKVNYDGLWIVSHNKSKFNTGYFQWGGKGTNRDRWMEFTAPADGYLLVKASNTGSSEDLTRLVTVENGGTVQNLEGGYVSTEPHDLVFEVKAGKAIIYCSGNALRFYKVLFSETDPTQQEEGGSGIPDYDPITGFEW